MLDTFQANQVIDTLVVKRQGLTHVRIFCCDTLGLIEFRIEVDRSDRRAVACKCLTRTPVAAWDIHDDRSCEIGQ